MNRPVPELPIAEEETTIAVSSAPATNGHTETVKFRTTVSLIVNQQDAPTCPNCGHIAVRNGACYKCLNCGESLGCS